MDADKYLKVNKTLWNAKTTIHVKSDFYDVEAFKKGKSSLNPAELEALGDVKNKSILHLQCHFGLDSLSWARLGANVTGIDLSDKAIEEARLLNDELGLNVKFICSDIYSLKNIIDEKFDIVFTSYGAIGWLPDIDKWAEIISHFLKPHGIFFIAEFHPVVCMFDDDFKKFKYSYFNSGPDVEEIKGTYADRNADIQHLSYQWSHSLDEVFSALLNHELKITSFKEYPFSYYNCFNNTVRGDDEYWRIKELEDKIPIMFSIKAIKTV